MSLDQSSNDLPKTVIVPCSEFTLTSLLDATHLYSPLSSITISGITNVQVVGTLCSLQAQCTEVLAMNFSTLLMLTIECSVLCRHNNKPY